jgi:SAM-dependent methyltransferase
VLVGYLSKPAVVVAADSDPYWAKGRTSLSSHFKKAGTLLKFIRADANSLPFPDNSFQVVTCQTLLIHLKFPEKALAEMYRVLQPGGIAICVEPNNLVSSLLRNSNAINGPIATTLRKVKFALLLERGKRELGEGDSSAGDFLPGLFVKCGFQNIQTFLSDKAEMMIPPYCSVVEKVILRAFKDWRRTGTGPFDYHGIRRYFKIMGKRSLKFFEEQWKAELDDDRQRKVAISDKRFHSAGASVLYLVSGNK